MSKSDEIREVLKVHPHLKDMEVVNFLSARGVQVSNPLVYQVRRNDGFKNSNGKMEEKEFTVKDLHDAREFITKCGSIQQARQLLDEYELLIS